MDVKFSINSQDVHWSDADPINDQEIRYYYTHPEDLKNSRFSFYTHKNIEDMYMSRVKPHLFDDERKKDEELVKNKTK